MKVNREQLKALIKECLVEILAEGLGPLTEQKVASKPLMRESRVPRRTALDNVSYVAPQRQHVPQHNPEIIKSVTSDPIMSSIFQDTLNTTLVKQDASGHNQAKPAPAISGDLATRVAAESDPTELFGQEAASRWAQAAFSKPRGLSPVSQQLYDDFNPYSEFSDINSR